MSYSDYGKLVIASLKVRKLRAYLTLLGVIIGIMAVVSLLSLGIGLQVSITEQFQSLGSNRITVAPGGEFLGPGTADLVTATIEDDDIEVVRRSRGVEEAEGVLTRNLRVEYDDQVSFPTLWTFNTDSEAVKFVEEVGLFDIGKGRELRSTDRFKAVLGYNIAEDGLSTSKSVEVGDKILIRDIEFDVVGIQELIGTGIHDGVVRIPQDTLREIIDEPDKYNIVFVKTTEGFVVEDVVESIKQDLRDFRNVKEGEEDFNVQAASQTIEQLNTVLLVVQFVIVGIAAISLLVGSIGIMNTMYTAVLERTKEIGIMKSIGASNQAIIILFLAEAALLGLVGGIIGMTIGLLIAKYAEGLAIASGASFFRTYISSGLIIGTLIFSAIIGMISGALPARQASRLKPVDALRSFK